MAVLRAVHDHPHADTDSILGVVREDLGRVSCQAVYDVLRALTVAGLVRRFQPMSSVARYESRVADNHHHLVCRSCGDIGDVDSATGDPPCLVPANDSGYVIGEAEVVYWGRCPECATADPAAPARLLQNTQRSTPARQGDRATGAAQSRATSAQNKGARQEVDPRV